jgi:hypothetical protein
MTQGITIRIKTKTSSIGMQELGGTDHEPNDDKSGYKKIKLLLSCIIIFVLIFLVVSILSNGNEEIEVTTLKLDLPTTVEKYSPSDTYSDIISIINPKKDLINVDAHLAIDILAKANLNVDLEPRLVKNGKNKILVVEEKKIPIAERTTTKNKNKNKNKNDIESMNNAHRLHFSEGINNREPVDIIEESTSSRRITFFSQLNGIKGSEIEHVWLFNEREAYRKKFSVGSQSWRVWTTKKIWDLKIGDSITVVILNKGKKIGEKTINYVD